MKLKTITLLTFIGLLIYLIFRIYSFYEVINLFNHRGETILNIYLVTRPLLLLANIFLIIFFFKLYQYQNNETSIKNIFEIQNKPLIDKIKNKKSKSMKKILFTIIGAILGLPLSYYFQPDMVQAKVGGIGGYIKNFGDIVNQTDLISNVVMGVIVFGLIGFVVGYFMDKNDVQKTD